MKKYHYFGALGLALGLQAAMAGDMIPAEGGNIEITPIRHAHVQIEFAGKVIHIDPWAGPAMFAAGLPVGVKPADILLITDIHDDHQHPPSIERLKKATTVFVAPAAVATTWDRPNTTVMANGETKTVAGVLIQAVAAYNIVNKSTRTGEHFHTKGRANAYVLTLGGKRILFTGDTECVPEIKGLSNIDVAFVTMNLPFTMPPSEAADCVKAFKPKIVYPYHYQQQGLDPSNKNQLDFVAAMKGTDGIEVRAVNFYPQR